MAGENPFDLQKFKTQIGQQATVQRSEEKGDHAELANHKLRLIGEELKPQNAGTLEYKGSACFHVYYNETLKQIFVISQTATLSNCPEQLARTAVKDFIGSCMEYFGVKRPRLRSGF